MKRIFLIAAILSFSSVSAQQRALLKIRAYQPPIIKTLFSKDGFLAETQHTYILSDGKLIHILEKSEAPFYTSHSPKYDLPALKPGQQYYEFPYIEQPKFSLPDWVKPQNRIVPVTAEKIKELRAASPLK